MNFEFCEVLSEIKLLAFDTDKGIGRQDPSISNYRPNHWFGNYQTIDSKTAKMFLMGNIKLLEKETLEPNESGIVQVYFVGSTENIDKIEVGFEWQMFEAPRLIGTGKVLEIWSKYEKDNKCLS